MTTLYHNPKCSKSRKTLELLEENGIEPKIVTYLTESPGPDAILRLAKILGVNVADLLRKGEKAFTDATDLPPLEDEPALAAWIHEHPITLQRTIAVNEASDSAVIGRPPENVLELLRK